MTGIIDRVKNEITVALQGDKITLCYPNLPAAANRVNLNFYHAEYPKGQKRAIDSGQRNLGDGISPTIVEYALQQRGLSLNTPIDGKRHLYAMGSIIFMGHQNATIWGSGLLTAPSVMRGILHHKMLRKLDIRSVRGPYTRKALQSIGHACPEVYGDPGVLLPLLYSPPKEKNLDYLIIPHVSMEKYVRERYPDECIASMATDDYKKVADKICSAKKVIASSLHGIIFAETYQVPAVFYQDRPEKYSFKYADWYEGTGRKQWLQTDSLEKAIEMDPNPAPDLTGMRDRLLDVFPYDLWE